MQMRLIKLADKVLMIEPHITATSLKKIPPAAYSINANDKGMVLLKEITCEFELPSKIYGNHAANKAMIVKALSLRETSVGALLVGMKGAGKTILAHDLANHAMSAGHPVFLVDQNHTQNVLRLVQSLCRGPCVFIFDEFAKVYKEKEERDDLLTFFSDQSIKNCLYLVMQNEEKDLPDAFVNRTGRFLFRINYDFLQRNEALEIVNDICLHDKHRSFLLDYVDQVQFSQNTLIDTVRQINQFGDTPIDDIIRVLNIPRPVFVNLTVEIGISTTTPLPGWEVQLHRVNKEDFQIFLVSHDGKKFLGTKIDIGAPLVGRGAERTEKYTYEGGVLPHPVEVQIKATTVAVDRMADYREPMVLLTEYTHVDKKEKA